MPDDYTTPPRGKSLKNRLQALHRRYEQYIPPVSFIGGFTYDTYTLKRIDLLFDNLLMLTYLFLASLAIIIIGRIDREHTRRPLFVNHLKWYVILLHFCMGSLFSAYTVLYFKSAAVGQSFIFVGLLLLILLVNEFAQRRMSRIKLLGAMHFFCNFAFFTFFLPVMTHTMDLKTFLSGGLISLGTTGIIWLCIYTTRIRDLWRDKIGILGPPIGIFLVLTLFYVINWIPPVPLSVQDIGIYRHVRRLDDGRYEVRYRKPNKWEPGRRDDREFEYTPGDTVFCFASAFAPTAMEQRIIHHWQWQNKQGNWVTTDKIGYDIVGGRDGGWRGYTRKRNLGPGKWRIDVETEDGKIIGHMAFKVELVSRKPKEMEIGYR